MSSQQSCEPMGVQPDAEALQKIAKVVDSEEFSGTHPTEMNLIMLPVAPGRFHACWALNPTALDETRQVFGLGPDRVKLVLRAYSYNGECHEYAHAQSSQDFPISGLNNSGYFDLKCPSESVGGVLGMVNAYGHFRPIVRGDTIALPQPARVAEPAPTHEPARTAQSDEAAHAQVCPPLDEDSVLARLPRLTDLPDELLKSPDDLAFYDREGEQIIFEADSVELASTPSLDEAAVHDAVISGNCQVLAILDPDASPLPAPTVPSAGASEQVGASELLASQWTGDWDSLAPLSLRAELTVNGRLGKGLKLALGDKQIRPLPGGQFKITRKLTAFNEVWPLFTMLGVIDAAQAGEIDLIEGTSAEPLLEIHASIYIEGRIKDEAYEKFLPSGVKLDANGRFSLHRPLPQGAVLLPGLSLIAEG